MTTTPTRGARFTTAVLLLVSTAATSYVLVDLAGVNTPRYYPLLDTWSTAPIADAVGMGFYGRFVVATLAALIVTLLYLIVSSLLARIGVVRTFAFAVKANIVIWFAAAIIVVEEWHEWGIAKRALDTGIFANIELTTFALGLGVALVGALIAALGLLRVSHLESLRKTSDDAPRAPTV